MDFYLCAFFTIDIKCMLDFEFSTGRYLVLRFIYFPLNESSNVILSPDLETFFQ